MKSYARNCMEILFLTQFLCFATRSKDKLCSTEWAFCCYGIIENLHIPFLRDKGYSLAAQVKRCFIIQIFYLFDPLTLEMAPNAH